MAFNYSPRIVVDGLVLYLDAANPKSYTSGSTTWRDLSKSAISGELVNSPIYNSSNAGFFQFATDDFARFQNSTLLDTQTPSVEVWVKTNNTAQNGFWFEKGTVNTQYSLFQESTVVKWRQKFTNGLLLDLQFTTATYLNTSSWAQVVGTFTNGNRKLYVNGNLINSDTTSGTIDTNTGGMSVGAYGGYSGSRGYYYNGNLSICKVYNRELTATEIQQNFDATKGRFGL